MAMSWRVSIVVFSFMILASTASRANAAAGGSVSGVIADQLGGPVAGATVQLIRDDVKVAETTSDAQGQFTVAAPDAGRYGLRITAAGFAANHVDPFFVAAGSKIPVTVTLSIGVAQAVVVTAAADALPSSQVAASVTVLDRSLLTDLAKPDVAEALRLVPGVNVVQLGGRGASTSLFVRGGSSAFNKVLIDGIPANDIGGLFDFGDVDTTGVERVEVLRNANSVLYGNDALAGVVALTTERGRTRVPEASYSIDGGTLGTQRHDVSVGGATNRLDYFAAFSHFDTDNDVANNSYRRRTFASRVGVAAGATDLSVVVRAGASRVGLPNAVAFYGLADDSRKASDAQMFSAAAETRVSPRLKTTIRYAVLHSNYHLTNPAPTGEYADPFGFGGNYLGHLVTITGANGYTVSGRAILDYGGVYPQPYDATTTRHVVSGQASYRHGPMMTLAAGARVEHEYGVTASSYDNPTAPPTTTRNNSGAFVEAQVFKGPVAVTAGLAVDHNETYGEALTPRVSAAAYLRKPSTTAAVGDTRLVFNAGTGIKAPTLAQELSSLDAAVKGVVTGVDPIGPERSSSFDIGLEQAFWQGRARARAAYFHNDFSDLIEYVSASALTKLGVSKQAADASGFGAYVNSSSYRAQGVELSADAALPHVTLTASYTFLDAEVTKSLSGGVLTPALNPAFPGIPIGQYAPLVGARPFRRPANSGSVMAKVARGPLQVVVAAYISGRQDDSTFLSDQFFGYSLLLPNHNLDAGFQKVDLSASYAIHRRAKWYLSVENLLNQDYQAGAGFPALPATVRTGVTVTVGGGARASLQ
jgi:iron complex outermembrane receptor protein/vitamin B12 transporter